MRRQLMNTFLAFFLCATLACQGAERFHLLRPDDSILTGYFDPPKKEGPYALALAIQGSPCESVWGLHQQFVERINGLGVGLITLEKQGVYGYDCIDETEYNKTNCRPHRINDYLWFIQKLTQGFIPDWNGELILLGGSEGGAIAATLAHQIPQVIAAVIFSSGGGIPCIEEIKIAAHRFTEREGYSKKNASAFLDFLDKKFSEIRRDPAHDKKFLVYTYKWWASHLDMHNLDDFLRIECPIYYFHDEEDELVPIESADATSEMFEINGKQNLTYRRLCGYGHDVRETREDLIDDAVSWLAKILEERSLPTPDAENPAK